MNIFGKIRMDLVNLKRNEGLRRLKDMYKNCAKLNDYVRKKLPFLAIRS